MNRFVVYARYSSELQSPASIEDQVRKCQEYADREGLKEVNVYADRAVSGSGMDRNELQQLMADVASPHRDFDIVLVDDTSRLSRSLRDSLDLHERFAHFGVRVIAVSQGIDSKHEQSELLVAMHGITDSLYVKELSKKTHRGVEGQFLKGFSAGGRCFGYTSVAKGEEGHFWVINEREADIVRQIFNWSASGRSLKGIAGSLNSMGVAPPRKRADRPYPTWCPSAIREMLRREIYIGRRVWNKTKFVKRPGTNKRVARPRPRTDWKIQEVPELRIVSDQLWAAVRERQDKLKQIYAPDGKPVNRAASSSYLLSGFLRCEKCDAKMIIVSGTGKTARYGCPQAWNRRACPNRVSFKARNLEKDTFQGLRTELQSSAAIEYLVADLLKEQERQRRSGGTGIKSAELKAEIDRIVAAIAAVGHSEALIASLQSKEQELKALEGQQNRQRHMTPEEVKTFVTARLEDIPALLAKAPEAAKAELSRQVDAIRLSQSGDGQIVLEGEWDLLGGTRGPVMVAGARFELATFGL